MVEREGDSLAAAVEEAARDKLGLERWDRPAIYREAAAAAFETGLSYWLVLALAGAIATLGLALDSSAVVIGAMLVAPLLAPIIGLALALAVGDLRLAVQSGAVVALSTLLVIAVGTLLTLLLPFHTVTLEISARTRPTTLDLAIAICSGLVGAVVTVGRGKRLSAAVPGVAVSVALIPPLAVAGFAVGAGLEGNLILGAMLLYGANLAGIIISGMSIFVLIGMHRIDVATVASDGYGSGVGTTSWLNRVPGARTLGVARSTWTRMALVGGFVVALGVPLSASLRQIGREVRVERAVAQAAERFEIEGRSSILDRRVTIGPGATEVRIRVVTTRWFDARDEEAFELRASTAAGEPIRLFLEQLPATAGDLQQLAELLPEASRTAAAPSPPLAPAELVRSLRDRLREAAAELALPTDVTVHDLRVTTGLAGEPTLTLRYSATEPLSRDAGRILAARLERDLSLPGLTVLLEHLPAEALPSAPPDSAS